MDGSHGRGTTAGPAPAWPLGAAFVLLTLVSLLNDVAAPDGYLLWACLAMVGLAHLARADGLDRWEWGLGRLSRRAARAAAVYAALTAAAMLLGTQITGVSDAYLDERVSGMSAGQIAFAALVRAPLGTALLEEVAFRGVLLAMLGRRFGAAWGVACSSIAFGVWHAVPALGLAEGNVAINSALGSHPAWAAAAAVVAAGVAGAFLCLLRIRYDHLIVPIAVHATAVSLGYVLAWLVLQS